MTETQIVPQTKSRIDHAWKNTTINGSVTFGNLKSLTLLNVRFTGKVFFNEAEIPEVVIKSCTFDGRVEGRFVCDLLCIHAPMALFYHKGKGLTVAGALISDLCSVQAD